MKSKDKKFLPFVKKYKNSIFIREFINIFIIVLVLLTVVNIVMFAAYSKLVNDQYINRNKIHFNQLKTTGDNIIDTTDKIVYSLMMDSEVSLFTSVDWSGFDNKYKYENAGTVIKYLKTHLMLDDYIYNIIIYSDINNQVITSSEVEPEEVEKYKAVSGAGKNEARSVEFAENYVDIYYPLNGDSFVVICIDAEKLSEKFNDEIDEEYTFYAIDNNENIVFANERDAVGKTLQNAAGITFSDMAGREAKKIKKQVFTEPSEVSSWRYIYLYPQNNLNSVMTSVFFFAVFAGSVLIAGFIGYTVAMRMYKPILNIIDILKNPNDDVRMNNLHNNNMFGEFEIIAENIISNFSTYDDIKGELEEKIRQLNKHQMMVLQSQINPHFLFNTLEVINLKAMMLNGMDNEVSEMIMDLSKLLRIGIESNEQLFTIRSELEHLKVYVRIMKLRYYDKFDVNIDVENEIMNCKICKITLQPLVENAVSHGIKTISGTGQIDVTGRRKGDIIRLEVSDNGAGMNDERLAEIRRIINSEEFIQTESIGLQNVNKRIQLMFGKEYGINIARNEKGGITVIMIIPYTY